MPITRELKTSHFDKFQCIGGACEDTCCAGWQIDIDKKSYKTYKNEKNINIKNLLQKNLKRNRQSNDDYTFGKFNLNEDEACGMLTPDGLCSIQIELGAKALCHTCTIYPRTFINVNGVNEKSLDLSCPEAARIVLFEKNGIDFIEDQVEDSSLIRSSISTSNETLFWQNRSFIISALQNRTHSIETRLMIIGLYVNKLEISDDFLKAEHYSNLFLDLLSSNDAEEYLKNFKPNYQFQVAMGQFFLSENQTSSKRFNESASKAFLNLNLDLNSNSPDEMKVTLEKFKDFYLKDQLISLAFENFLVNFTFSAYFEVNSNSLKDFYSKIIIQFALLRLLTLGNSTVLPSTKKESNDVEITISEETIVKTIQSFSKKIMHNFSYLDEVKKIITTSEYSTIAQAMNIIKLY